MGACPSLVPLGPDLVRGRQGERTDRTSRSEGGHGASGRWALPGPRAAGQGALDALCSGPGLAWREVQAPRGPVQSTLPHHQRQPLGVRWCPATWWMCRALTAVPCPQPRGFDGPGLVLTGGGFRPSPRPSTACSPARPCVASGVDWKSGWFRSVAWNPPQVVFGTRSALGPAPVCRTFQGGCQCGAQTALESRRGHGLPVARAVGTLGPGHYGRSPGQSPGAWCFRSVCCKGMDERVFRRFEEFAFYMCFFTYTLALFAELMLLTPV